MFDHFAVVAAALILATAPIGASAAAAAKSPGVAQALFAGGCFWSMESAFDKTYGVIDAVAGYTGGTTKNPNYQNYAETGHVEAVQVTFDPSRVSYEELLDVYWRHTDPTDSGGAFVDRGPQYRPIVYFADAVQRGLRAFRAAGVLGEVAQGLARSGPLLDLTAADVMSPNVGSPGGVEFNQVVQLAVDAVLIKTAIMESEIPGDYQRLIFQGKQVPTGGFV